MDQLTLPLLLNIAASLTILFLFVTLTTRFTGVAEALEPFFRIGLVASGTAWVALALREIMDSPSPPWLVPLISCLVFLIPNLLKKIWRWGADLQLKRKGDWRCPYCGKENEKIAPVCYYCQGWRKKS